jgi:hypothetical protein
MIFTTAKNIINPIINTKPPMLNLLALSVLFSKTSIAEKANTATIGTVIEIKIDLLGNSAGEKEEIVRRIKRPESIVTSIRIMSLPLRSIVNVT